MIDIEKEICSCGGTIHYSNIEEIFDITDDDLLTIKKQGECNICHKKYLWETKCMILEETLTIETNS